jgi:hypothetical protein
MQICREAAGQLKAQGSKLKAMTPTVSMPNGKFPTTRQTAIGIISYIPKGAVYD